MLGGVGRDVGIFCGNERGQFLSVGGRDFPVNVKKFHHISSISYCWRCIIWDRGPGSPLNSNELSWAKRK